MEGPPPSREARERTLVGSRPSRPRPRLDGEPRRTPGLEVKALAYQSDPAVDRTGPSARAAPPAPHQRTATRAPTTNLTNPAPYQCSCHRARLGDAGVRSAPSESSGRQRHLGSKFLALLVRRHAAPLRED